MGSLASRTVTGATASDHYKARRIMNNTSPNQSRVNFETVCETRPLQYAERKRPVALNSDRFRDSGRSRSPYCTAITILLTVMIFAILVWLPPIDGIAQSGALIPVSVKNELDPTILSLPVMKVEVRIDNQHA